VSPYFCELASAGLIAFQGPDAAAFLHAQLTSDVAGLAIAQTQYSGYCSPKGRLLATPLLWRRADDILLQLPANLREGIQSRLSKYILRSRVSGISGADARAAVLDLVGDVPDALHATESREGVSVTRLPIDRYLVVVDAAHADATRAALSTSLAAQPEVSWSALDVEAGIPVLTRETQEQYVPQMVNLDLIGGVSYTKGCYPGQEIVARMHYLGRLKQRMYRVRLGGDAIPQIGDLLYSAEFGPDQSSGTILTAAPASRGGHEALAVIQKSSASTATLHWRSLDGPAIEILPLPYALDS
jgi:folate-binding protein YgfZ